MLAISIILIVSVFYFTTIREGHNWGGDFSMYIRHAKNIAEGTDYKDTGYIYNPFYPYFAPKTYPPVFPFLLALVYKLFGLKLAIMKIEVILFFLMSLFIIFLVFKAELPFQYSLVMIAVVGFNPYFWDFKDNILSDIPFMFFTYLSILLINRAYQSDSLNRSRKIQMLYIILVGISIYLSYGTRGIGIALVPSLLIYDIIKRKRPSRFAIKVTILVVFFIILQNVFLHNESSYFKLLTISYKVIFGNILSYIRSLSNIWNNGFSEVFKIALFVFISGLAIIGCLTRVKSGITIFEIYFVLHMAIVIIWPMNQGTRFLIPVIPLYLFYSFLGVQKISSFHGNKLGISVPIILVVAIFISYAIRYIKIDYGPIREGIAKKETVDLFSYIKQSTKEGDVFIFRKPRVLFLYTGRRASIYHQPQDDKELWNYFHEIKANYVIVGQVFRSDVTFLSHFVEKYKDHFREVYSNPDFKVYRISFVHNSLAH